MSARIGVLGFVAALVAVAAAPAGATWRAAENATTASYKLTFDVGPMEAMYTRAQAKAEHPSTGEVMLAGGAMAAVGTGGHAMGMEGGLTGHVEVHVRSRSTGRVLGGLTPAILLQDVSTKSVPVQLQVVSMEGVGAGAADLHYGNNVSLQAGHRYRVVVRIDGQRATFGFRAPS
jgi:hypothetical protein